MILIKGDLLVRGILIYVVYKMKKNNFLMVLLVFVIDVIVYFWGIYVILD